LFGQSALQEAAQLAGERHYQEARKALEGVKAPADPQQQLAFHRLQAAIASGLNEPAVAAREMEQALALDPANSNLILATGLAELTAGELASALSHVQASSESATKEALLGDILEAKRDWAGAVKAYRTAIQLTPSEEKFRIALGMELLKHQQPNEAVAALKDAAEAMPGSVWIRTLLGVAHFANGYEDEAIRALENAVALDARSDAPRAALAKIVLKSSAVPSKRTEEILCGWKQTICSALQLRIARASGDRALLLRATDNLKHSMPTDAVGKCELARAFEYQDDLQSARPELETCVRLDPTPQNHYRLGILYQRLNLPDLASHEMAIRARLLQITPEETTLGLSDLTGTVAPTQ
jgi:tetratricopeptide (TPR) repeat protein